MALHLTKIAFGCPSLAELQRRLAARGKEARLTTRYCPKRVEELTGGSLFWIIAHTLVARSPILSFEARGDGKTDIVIAAQALPVRPTPRRAHQGWRYLKGEDAPADLGADAAAAALPPELEAQLAAIALL